MNFKKIFPTCPLENFLIPNISDRYKIPQIYLLKLQWNLHNNQFKDNMTIACSHNLMSESCSQSVRPSPSSSQLAVMSCHNYYPPLTSSLPAPDNGCRYAYIVISPKSGHHTLNPKLLYSTHLGFSFFSPEHHFCIWVCVILPLHIFCCMYYDLQQASTLRCTIWGPFHFIVCIFSYFLLFLLAQQLTD